MNGTSRHFAPLDDLLVLASRLPHARAEGQALRSYHMLRFLSQHYRVHFAAFYTPRTELALLGKLKPLCYETCFVEHAPLLPRAPTPAQNGTLNHWLGRLLKRQPVRAALALDAPMAACLLPFPTLRRVVDLHGFERGDDLDAAQGRDLAAAAAGEFRATGVSSVAGVHGVSSVAGGAAGTAGTADSAAAASGAGAAGAAPRNWRLIPLPLQGRRAAAAAVQRQLANQFDRITFGSTLEARRFAALEPQAAVKCAILPGGVDADHFSPHIIQRTPYQGGERAIVLAGAMDTIPMIEAAEWFCAQVFAPLRTRVSGLRLYIIGERPHARVRRLARRDSVIVGGAVADLRPYLAHAALAVAPLRRLAPPCEHLLAALAMQTSVIASPESLAPLGLNNCPDLLVAHDASQFIAHIEGTLGQSGQGARMLAARARMLADYSWNAQLAPLCELLDGAAADIHPGHVQRV
jgi:glycosyltransferase involved in cell wall biosynthesis